MNARDMSENRFQQKPEQHREKLSPALMKMADGELKDFNTRSDEAFLIRADMDKKLNSL